MQKSEEVDNIYYRESFGLLFYSYVKIAKEGRTWLVRHQFGSVVNGTVHTIGNELKTISKVKEMRSIFLALDAYYNKLEYTLWSESVDNAKTLETLELLKKALTLP